MSDWETVLPAGDGWETVVPKPPNAREALANAVSQATARFSPQGVAGAAAKGYLQGLVNLAGMPMDTLANLTDLGHAFTGYVGNKLGYLSGSQMPDLLNRESLGGTAQNLTSLIDRTPAAGITANPNPEDMASRLAYGTGQMAAGPAIFGKPTVGATVAGGVAGAAQQGAAEAGLPPSGQILSSLLAPYAMKGTQGYAANRQQALQQSNADAAERVRIAQEFQQQGGKLAPAEINPTMTTRLLQGALAGNTETQYDISRSNQPLTNTLVRRDLGMPRNTPLSRENIDNTPAVVQAKSVGDQIRQQPNMLLDISKMDLGDAVKRYQSARQVDPQARNPQVDALISAYTPKPPSITMSPSVLRLNPQLADQVAAQSGQRILPAGALLDRAAALRKAGFANIDSENGKTKELGHVQLAISDALEQQIKFNLEAQKRGDLAQSFDSARTILAKANDVKSALDAGQVNPVVIGNKFADNPNVLTGGLRQIGEAQQAFPKDLQHIARATPGFNPRDMRMWAYGAMIPAGIGGSYASGSLYPLAVSAIPAAGYATRKFLTSNLGQSLLARPKVPTGPVSKLAQELLPQDYSGLLGSYGTLGP